MARRWIDSKKPLVAAAGWSTWSALVSVQDDRDLDVSELKELIHRVETTIHKAPDPVRYAMNGFLIAVGCFVKALTAIAKATGERIGPVTADLGNNACRIPFAPEYIRKVEKRGSIGRKRKTAKC